MVESGKTNHMINLNAQSKNWCSSLPSTPLLKLKGQKSLTSMYAICALWFLGIAWYWRYRTTVQETSWLMESDAPVERDLSNPKRTIISWTRGSEEQVSMDQELRRRIHSKRWLDKIQGAFSIRNNGTGRVRMCPSGPFVDSYEYLGDGETKLASR